MRSLLSVVLAVACWVPAVRAASPREELLHLVPEDVGFCLVLENLSTHGKALANSPFVDQFRSSPLAATIRNAPETEKLTALDQFLQKYLDLTAAQLCDEILGDALVVAYRPGPPGKPEEEEGLFLLRARDARLLARLVERIQSLQKESGDLQDLEERTYRGEKYFRRLEGKGTNFYYLQGPLFAFASREGILRQLIDRRREANDAESPVARQFRLLGVGKSLAALWINPRAFDAALQEKAAAAVGVQAVALRTLLVYWKALEGIALSVALEKDFALSVSVRANVEQMPPSARQFLRTAGQPSEVWQRFPEDALLTVSGRLDIPALVEMVGEFFAPDAQKSLRAIVEGTVEAVLGRNMVQHILPNLGPDWGICLFSPPASDRGWMPQILGALRVRSGSVGAPVDLAVLNALNALATLAVFHHNGGQPGPLSLKSLLQDQIEVKYLVNDEQFPQGLQPAFALKGGYLVVASSPDVIRRFRVLPAQPAAELAADVPLLTLSLRGWCQCLRERRESILEYAAAKNQVSKEEAGRRVDHLLVVLQLFDRVELTQRSGPERVTLTLRVQTAKPLR